MGLMIDCFRWLNKQSASAFVSVMIETQPTRSPYKPKFYIDIRIYNIYIIYTIYTLSIHTLVSDTNAQLKIALYTLAKD